MLKAEKYWENCTYCGAETEVTLPPDGDASMPPERSEVNCTRCCASGSVAYMGKDDHFIQWDALYC